MSNSVNQTIEGIEENFNLYTESLNKLRSFLNEFEQIDIFYKTININFNIDDISTFKNQINFTGFLTVSILDLLVVSKNIIVSKYQWERINQLKLGCMIIYEAIRTYHSHKEISSLAKNDSKSNELYKSISSDLKAFKNEFDYPKTFNKIRNAIIAHVKADFKSYYDTVSKIDGDKYFNAIIAFLQILFKMQELSKYLSDTLTLQKADEAFNINRLLNEMSEKMTERLNE